LYWSNKAILTKKTKKKKMPAKKKSKNQQTKNSKTSINTIEIKQKMLYKSIIEIVKNTYIRYARHSRASGAWQRLCGGACAT
jgi:hypothetical protein